MSAIQPSRSYLLKALRCLLRPVANFCLRSSLSFQDLTECAKGAFVEAAEAELRKSTGKINLSRLSVLTGLHRKDIARLRSPEAELPPEPASVLGRVIGQWEQDRRFQNSSGEPKVLSFEGKESEFYRLVSTISKAINPSTVLFELIRAGAAVKSARGLKLARRSHKVLESDDLRVYDLLARDIDSLIRVVEGNALNTGIISNLHIRTDYDNIYVRDLYKVRRWLIDQGKLFHKKARAFLSSCDKDVNPSSDPNEPAGQHVSFTTFSLAPLPLEMPKPRRNKRSGVSTQET